MAKITHKAKVLTKKEVEANRSNDYDYLELNKTNNMVLNINQDLLIDLVNGVSPSFGIFENPIIKRSGTYNGSYGTWSWKNEELKKLSKEELIDLYYLVKNSYN